MNHDKMLRRLTFLMFSHPEATTFVLIVVFLCFLFHFMANML